MVSWSDKSHEYVRHQCNTPSMITIKVNVNNPIEDIIEELYFSEVFKMKVTNILFLFYLLVSCSDKQSNRFPTDELDNKANNVEIRGEKPTIDQENSEGEGEGEGEDDLAIFDTENESDTTAAENELDEDFDETIISKEDYLVLQKKAKKTRPSILNNDNIKKYLEDHKVYLSLTTSPKRIDKIEFLLKPLHLELIEKIYLALPQEYGRTKEKYTDLSNIKDIPKLEIIRIEKDLGPLTKIAPAVEHVLKKTGDKDAIVISIDDDTGYPNSAIPELIKQTILKEKTVIAGSSQNLIYWSIDSERWPEEKFVDDDKNCENNNYCHVVEGFGMIAYRAGYLNTEKMKELALANKKCYLSDDLVISYVLAKSKIKKFKISNEYFSLSKINQLSYGFEEDALHRTNEKEVEGNVNEEKYQECANFIYDM